MATADDEHLSWPLASSVLPTIGISAAYVLCVKVVGPRLMKDRPAMQLNNVKLIYDIAMIIVNLYLFLSFSYEGWLTTYSYTCQEIDWSPKGIPMSRLTYYYFLTRFVEFTDTVLFILSKKFSHVSALHVIHHSTVPICTYIGFSLSPNGHGTFCTFVNSFIHVVMYTYYAMTAMGPRAKPYLWWKRYLTQLQLIQFMLIFGHGAQVLFQPSCAFPRLSIYTLLATMIYLFGLFAHFYLKAYSSRVTTSSSSSPLKASSRRNSLREKFNKLEDISEAEAEFESHVKSG